jgi:selenocysteine-specific elongation factor
VAYNVCGVHVLGTAGHVDHGKSALVRALTGTDPDRWIEERLRGMTLDLGFAHLRFEDGTEAGIVDVPGHERFLHNMLAGAAGMELLLLVVAANEGPRPQTAEHVALLGYLNVRRTIVVLTKADLVDADELAFARELTREFLTGTFADGAPSIAVSSVTGAGLEELRAAIHDALIALPPRLPDAPAYMPVDRVFSLAGYGTIVTGTLMQGRIATGDELLLAPPARTVRVRGLQVFGAKRDLVVAGSRVAINLPGIETSEIARGDVLASAQFALRSSLEVTFRPLPLALGLLKRRTPVRAYLGSAEILGTLAFERVPESADTVPARLHLRTPTVVVPGAAFVVRRLSPKTLLGGGNVAGVDVDALTRGDDSDDVTVVLAALQDAGLDGLTAMAAGAVANLRAERAEEALAMLLDDGRALRLQRPPGYVDADVAGELFARVCARLAVTEAETPWLPGATALALSRALGVPEAPLARLLAAFVEDGAIAYRAGYYATPGFIPDLRPEQKAFFARLFEENAAQPNAPLPFENVRQALRSGGVPALQQAFETLLASGALVRIDDAVYRGEQVARIRALLESALRRDKQITMSAFRELAGTSRKFAVPLLEWFDAAGVTIRSGDVRVLRRKAE